MKLEESLKFEIFSENIVSELISPLLLKHSFDNDKYVSEFQNLDLIIKLNSIMTYVLGFLVVIFIIFLILMTLTDNFD